MTLEDSLRSLSLDYLNLLINGQAFSDVTFNVEGRLVHAHRCILAARSLFFRKFFCGPDPPAGLDPGGSRMGSAAAALATSPRGGNSHVIPVNSVGYEVFLLVLQFLYSGQSLLCPRSMSPGLIVAREGVGTRIALQPLILLSILWLLLDLSASNTCIAHSGFSSFDPWLIIAYWKEIKDQLEVNFAQTTHIFSSAKLPKHHFGLNNSIHEYLFIAFYGLQKQLASMVEKASIEDVMKVLIASRKQDMHQLWTTCSHLVAKSGLPPEVLAKHLPIDVVAKIEELRLKSSLARRSLMPHHHHHQDIGAAADLEDQKIRRMRRALDSSDVELVKLMVMGEGLNLDEALALHYAVENCSREVVKALLELGAADVNYPLDQLGKLHSTLRPRWYPPIWWQFFWITTSDPNVRTVDGVTPLDVLRTLTSDFLFKGAVPGLTHIEPNKLRLCLELVQSAALVLSREEGSANAPSSTTIYPPMSDDHHSSSSSSNMASLNLDSRLVYLNLGATGSGQMGSRMDREDDVSHNNQREAMNRHGSQGGCDTSMYHHSHEY
ncbi:Regulatory protein NPR5 [Vitis vinifera]|uniref:Regulatory protein NPR5 n=1 Tax=Vitis vinifera TaxID=29760 RepID=A0A438I6I4_VITVI|nr:Regulatory protein NPR5 [Vitis vinifera]